MIKQCLGERISHCVQMWWYYLQGLQTDLWNSLSPKIASNMYAKIFDHTYGILVGRYAKVNDISSLIHHFEKAFQNNISLLR